MAPDSGSVLFFACEGTMLPVAVSSLTLCASSAGGTRSPAARYASISAVMTATVSPCSLSTATVSARPSGSGTAGACGVVGAGGALVVFFFDMGRLLPSCVVAWAREVANKVCDALKVLLSQLRATLRVTHGVL